MLRNILGPVFNFNLDQFLTLEFCYFFGGGGGWNPYFYSRFQQNMQNWKKHQKRKNDTICEHTCANCSCQNVRFFSAFFIFAVFGISMFFRDVFDRFPKFKK